MNNSDVGEQCINAGVQISNVGPATINDAGNSNINVAGSNYAFVIWNPNGTGIYYFNRDNPAAHFNKIN